MAQFYQVARAWEAALCNRDRIQSEVNVERATLRNGLKRLADAIREEQRIFKKLEVSRKPQYANADIKNIHDDRPKPRSDNGGGSNDTRGN